MADAVWIRNSVADKGPPVPAAGDRTAPSWIELHDGRRFVFDRATGATVRLASLAANEILLAPGLVYRRADQTRRKEAAHG